ncbi:MAG: DnaB-like helicase C-terminal domain-containing protein [Acidobacteriota bacterium]
MKNLAGLDKALPHSVETERAVLAAFLLDPSQIGVHRFEQEDFYFENHQTLYSSFVDLFEAEGAEGVDLRTVQAHLEARGELQKVGGLGYLSAMDLELPDLARLWRYASLVKSLAAERTLILEAQKIVWSLLEGELTSENKRPAALLACERLEAVAQKVGVRLERRPPIRVDAAVDDVIEEAMAQANRSDAMVGVRTGLADLDRKTLGFGPGELITVAASPGRGKTAFALNVAAHVAIHEGKPVAFLSLEMDEIELARRVLACEADISHTAIRSGSLSKSDWQDLVTTHRSLVERPLFLRHPSDNSLSRITSDARAMAAERAGLALLVIDYLQLLQAGGSPKQRNLEIAAITRSLKRLAKELRAPILLLSQLSREHIKNNRRPGLADLRDSNAIESDSDKVFFLYREVDEEVSRGSEAIVEIELLGRKDRHGVGHFDLPLTFEGDKMRFSCGSQPTAEF